MGWQLEELEWVFQDSYYFDVFMREVLVFRFDFVEFRVQVGDCILQENIFVFRYLFFEMGII